MKNMSKLACLLLLFTMISVSQAKAQVLLGLVNIPLEILDFETPGNSETIGITILNDLYKTKLNSPVLQVTFETDHTGEFTIDKETIDLSSIETIPAVLNVKVSYSPASKGTHYNRLAIRGTNTAGENVLLTYVNLRGASNLNAQ